MKTHATALVATILATSQLHAQVRCTMPNGVVIEQKLSDTCPAGATKSQTADGKPAPTRSHPAAERPATPTATSSGPNVKSSDFGNTWPLTVPSGTLRCILPLPSSQQTQVLLFESAGKTYTLNGTASSLAAKYGWQDVRSIWRDNPSIPGTKVPISPLIQRASALCTSSATPMPAATAPDPEQEITQAKQMCALVEASGGARCTANLGLFTAKFSITSVGTRSDFVSLCDSMKEAARKKFPAVRNSARGWQVEIEHGINRAITYSCVI